MASWKKIITGSVETDDIGTQQVTGAKIADDAIDSQHYTDRSIDTEHIQHQAITNVKLADDAINHPRYIADNVIGADQIDAGAVGNSELADSSVTGAKLTTNAINSSAKLGTGVVTTAKISDLAVSSAKLANDAVTQAKIADQAVGTDQIAQEAIIADHIADEAIENNHIGEESVGTSAIEPGAVTTARINDEAVTNDKMADDAIRSQNLDVTNSPTTGYLLSASPTPQGLTWVEPVVAHNYVVFNHNFADDIGTSEIYIPWTGISETSSAPYSNSFMLVPFSNMKFRRFMFRINTVNQLSATLTVDLKKVLNNQTAISTVDTVNLSISYYNNNGYYSIEDGTGSSQLNYTASFGEMVGFSVDASVDWAGHQQYFATSIWEIEGTSIG